MFSHNQSMLQNDSALDVSLDIAQHFLVDDTESHLNFESHSYHSPSITLSTRSRSVKGDAVISNANSKLEKL